MTALPVTLLSRFSPSWLFLSPPPTTDDSTQGLSPFGYSVLLLLFFEPSVGVHGDKIMNS